MQSPIVLDDKYIIPACLPESDDNLVSSDLTNKIAWMTGWVDAT